MEAEGSGRQNPSAPLPSIFNLSAKLAPARESAAQSGARDWLMSQPQVVREEMVPNQRMML